MWTQQSLIAAVRPQAGQKNAAQLTKVCPMKLSKICLVN